MWQWRKDNNSCRYCNIIGKHQKVWAAVSYILLIAGGTDGIDCLTRPPHTFDAFQS